MPLDHSLFEQLELVATMLADKPAIIAGARRLTYGELLDRINLFSANLSSARIRPSERVAVVLPNGAEFLIAAFSIWKRGAILVPLHSSFQEQEILKYVLDCRVRAVIAGARMGPIVQ